MKRILDHHRSLMSPGFLGDGGARSISRFIKRMTRAAFFLAAVVMLGACATATGPLFAEVGHPVTDMGDVYLYRTERFISGARAFPVLLNDQKVAELYNGSYLWFRMKPGFHSLTVAPGLGIRRSEIQITVQPGQTSFYEYDLDVESTVISPVMYMSGSIKERWEASAVKKLHGLRLASDSNAAPIVWDRAGLFAAIEDSSAVPGLDDKGREGYRRFLRSRPPRAFVIAEDGNWESVTENLQATKLAINKCRYRQLKQCRLYAVDNVVVWKAE